MNVIDQRRGERYAYYHADCVQAMAGMPDKSIDLTVTSIPFASLYTYSDNEADVGNAGDHAEFWEHMRWVILENWRITREGRNIAIHVKDLPLFANRDGVQGVMPFSDDTVAAYRALRICGACGWGGYDVIACPECNGAVGPAWVLQSRITIEKDPVIEMQKSKSHGLLYQNWRERAELLRTGLPDYVIIFQRVGDDRDNRVKHDPSDLEYHGSNPPADYRIPRLPSRSTGMINASLPVWQEYANPVWGDVVAPENWAYPLEWMGDLGPVWRDINQMNTLNYRIAKGKRDERHICPLQLDLIGRLIHWKSNPDDVVFDPFGGIASTGVKAVEMGRRFVGCELKPEYFDIGSRYLEHAEGELDQMKLF